MTKRYYFNRYGYVVIVWFNNGYLTILRPLWIQYQDYNLFMILTLGLLFLSNIGLFVAIIQLFNVIYRFIRFQELLYHDLFAGLVMMMGLFVLYTYTPMSMLKYM